MFASAARQLTSIEQHLDIVVFDNEVLPPNDCDFDLLYCGCQHYAPLVLINFCDYLDAPDGRDAATRKKIPGKLYQAGGLAILLLYQSRPVAYSRYDFLFGFLDNATVTVQRLAPVWQHMYQGCLELHRRFLLFFRLDSKE